MDKSLTLDPAAEESPEEIAAIKAELQQCRDEWEKIKQRMDARRRNIDNLKSETRATLASLQEQIGKL